MPPTDIRNAIAALDAVIEELMTERQRALPQLAHAKGVTAEQLAIAVAGLDDKLAQVRAKRAETVRRMERTARMDEIKHSLRSIKEEAETGELSPSRRAQLKQQAMALQAEGAALIAESKRGRGET